MQNGKLDLGLIPARAWDELGVTSLQALQAPFLVSSEDLVEQVVEGDPAAEMLAGLDKAGVVGLALLPEGLRHPVGFARPFLAPGDFAGATIRALPSNASYRLLEALGAKPVDVWADALPAAVANGEIDGAESGFAWAGALPSPSTFTANITFYPKVNALVANEDVVRPPQRRAARDPSGGRRQGAALRRSRTHPPRRKRAAVYCRNGGAIAFASVADVAALERAAQPVYEALQADPQTKRAHRADQGDEGTALRAARRVGGGV